MCLLHKPLACSHFMPAVLYEYCRTSDDKPFRVGSGFVIPTDCQNILSGGGETWILEKLATWERKFPLYDLLTQQPPEFDEEGVRPCTTRRKPRHQFK